MWKTCLGLEVGKMDGKEKRDTEDIIWVASEMMWYLEACAMTFLETKNDSLLPYGSSLRNEN